MKHQLFAFFFLAFFDNEDGTLGFLENPRKKIDILETSRVQHFLALDANWIISNPVCKIVYL